MAPGGAATPAYTVKLEVFEGPLDLLLHLIRREEMDIYDIPIARITEQYLDYLDRLATIDLDTASEFLLMAATLMDIKSRMLLPRPSPGEFIDDEAQADPRRELVARLLEYRRYKEAAQHLAGRAQAARRVHSRYGGSVGPPPPLTPTALSAAHAADSPRENAAGGGEPREGAAEVTLSTLVAALQDVLRELQERPSNEIIRETVTVAGKIAEIVPALVEAGEKGLDFLGFLRRAGTRRVAVVTFLALLELLRQGRVRLIQERPFGPVVVYARIGIERWGWPGRD